MTKTIHPFLSHYLFTTWGGGREGAMSNTSCVCVIAVSLADLITIIVVGLYLLRFGQAMSMDGLI